MPGAVPGTGQDENGTRAALTLDAPAPPCLILGPTPAWHMMGAQ